MRLQTTHEEKAKHKFLNDTFDQEYEKEMMLVEIQKIREAKKQRMMTFN